MTPAQQIAALTEAQYYPQPARDDLSFAMFAAWLNCAPDKVPMAFKAWTCPQTRAAWERVAAAALAAAQAPAEVEPRAWLVRERPGFPWRFTDGDPDRQPNLRGFEVKPLYDRPQASPTVQDAARVLLIASDRGVCVGGRWDGWLMVKHPDGQWVSHHKLDAVSPITEMSDLLRAIADAK